MEYTIQGLKTNIEYTLKLNVEIYDGNGAHPLYQKLFAEHSRTSSYRKSEITSKVSPK